MTQDLPALQVDDAVEVPSTFTVTLQDCLESVGVGLVPTERARPLIPPEFQLLDQGQPVTPLVVLAFKCEGIEVAGHMSQAGVLAQVGLMIVPPDGTGDFNTYLLWHYTSDTRLAQAMNSLGYDSQHVPAIGYDVTLDDTGGTTSVRVPWPAYPALALGGPVTRPSRPDTSVVANWWAKVDRGLMKLQTSVPERLIGTAELTLTTRTGSPLGQLIGGNSLGFAAVQQFSAIPHALTQASIIGEDEDHSNG